MMQVFPSEAFLRRWAIRIALVWFAVLYARTAWVSRDEHALGVVAERAGDLDSAVAHHRRALRHAAPPFDAATESLVALVALADRARASRTPALELEALRAIRGSLIASRWILPRREEARRSADRGIARVVSELDRSPEFRGLGREQVERAHLRELEREPSESSYGVFLAVVGFFSFVYFANRLLTSDIGVDDTWDVVAVRATLVRLGISFVTFVVGLVVT